MTRRPLTALALLVSCLASVPVLAADIPKPALDPYLQLQTALAADSLADAQKAATTFVAQITPLGPALAKAIAPAKAISTAADIKAARTAFGDLSDIMLALAGDGTGGKDVRVAYCPMVKKSWLQTGTEIANPYYGASMLRCGTFTK